MDDTFIQLTWHAHQVAFLNTLSSLRDKQVYTDVTLSCGDQFYPAHRLVLSACSTFLARTLEVASCKAPVILLHGIDQSTLEQLLMIMYDGQVTISRDELPKLLKAAQWLGVKGLESVHDKHGLNDSKSECQSQGEQCDSSPLQENWRQCISSVSSTNKQQESIENAVKFYKQITSKIQDIGNGNDKRSESLLDSSEAETSQESKFKDSISGLNFSVGTVTDPVAEKLWNSSSSTQQMENSYPGWMENETGNNFHVEDIIEEPVVDAEVDNVNSSGVPKESAETSEENTAADMNKRSLKCKHCRRSFKVRRDLARHLRIHHDDAENYCFTCQTKFMNKKELSIHMKLHSAQTLHSCNLCEFVSHSSSGLKKHILVQHRTASDSDAILPQVELVEGSKQKSRSLPKTLKRECPICQRLFKNETVLKEHIDAGCQGIIRSKNLYHCPLCMYVSDRLRSVEDHLCRHTGVYRFRCSLCPYQCSRNFHLREHMRKRHPEFETM